MGNVWITRGKVALIGRAEMVSISQRISTSYSCSLSCSPTYSAYLTSAPPSIMNVGQTGTATAEMQMGFGNGCYYTFYAPSWSIDNDSLALSVATNNERTIATVTAQYAGDTELRAFFGVYDIYVWDDMIDNCRYSHTQDASTWFYVSVVCAVPVNFRQTAVSDAGGGTLHFEYAWNSTSGRLSDLSTCKIQERVDYNSADIPFPPPFPPLSPTNPTILSVVGSDGIAQDNHRTPGTFVKPYSAKSITAQQLYGYRCPCANNGNTVVIVGPINLVRAVSQNSDGTWKFIITKSSASASINPLP